MESASLWLASVVLLSISAIVITMTVVLINNLLSKYWKPVKFVSYQTVQYDFEPTIEDTSVESKKKK